MPSMNKVFLMGNLTRDVDVKYTPGGIAICEFGLATSRKYKDKEEVCFVDITAWGKMGESCGQYLAKGFPVMVEGRLNFDQWEDKATGKKRSKISVTAESVQFLSRRPAQEESPEVPGVDYKDIPF